MGILRQLSYAGTTIILTSLGLSATGCSGSTGVDNSGAPAGAGTTMNPDGSMVIQNPDGTVTTVGPDGTITTMAPDGTPTANPPGMGSMAPPVGTGVTDPTVTPTTTLPPDPPPPGACAGVPATSQVGRLLNREYDHVIRDLLGMTTLASGEPPSAQLSDDYDGPMDTFSWNAYQTVAAQVAAEVISGPNKSNFINCDPAAVASCYQDTITSFGRKAFRRPMTDEEVQRFMELTTIQPAGTPDEIAEALLEAFLVSPSFIIVPEMTATPEGNAIKLSSHEVATRLSLTLWGSIPDAELNAAADANELQTREQILAQAQRMIQVREKVGPQVAEAHRDYLVMDEASHWWKISHPSDVFPNYSDALRPTLRSELDAFFEEIAFSGGSFKDIFLSTTAFVNQDTAALYGLNPADFGPELEKVDLPDRPGFLTRAGFLSSFSSPQATSPILRGAFITVNILGVDPGPPVDGAAGTPIPPGDYQTRREQIEALTEPADCSGCHSPLVNPPGFVLENYDAVGGWQEQDPLGGPIDATATVIFSGDNQKMITSPQEMMQEIANTVSAREIYARRLVSYATGRLPNDDDECIAQQLSVKLADDGYTALNLLADLTQAESFRLRTVGN